MFSALLYESGVIATGCRSFHCTVNCGKVVGIHDVSAHLVWLGSSKQFNQYVPLSCSGFLVVGAFAND